MVILSWIFLYSEINKNPIIIEQMNKSKEKCYLPSDNSNLKIIHLIFTRFMMEFFKENGFPKKMYEKDYVPNGIRVMEKYLFSSLLNQNCMDFIWILLLGNKANITYIKSLINVNECLKHEFVYQKDIKNYVKKISKGFDILITTRIDYDDLIYYDAVNDIRKQINMNKPLLLHGYNRGVIYYESNNKYYDFYYGSYNNSGTMSIFFSLINILNKTKDAYTILDFGDHRYIRKKLIREYKLFGIKRLNYEPSIFDSGDPKYIHVRQKYSGSYNKTSGYPKYSNNNNFNLSRFFGSKCFIKLKINKLTINKT